MLVLPSLVFFSLSISSNSLSSSWKSKYKFLFSSGFTINFGLKVKSAFCLKKFSFALKLDLTLVALFPDSGSFLDSALKKSGGKSFMFCFETIRMLKINSNKIYSLPSFRIRTSCRISLHL